MPTESLNRNAQIFLESHRIHDVPAIHSETHLRTVDTIRADDLVHARVGRAVFLILFRFLVLEVIGAAEIILRARATDGRPFVAIHVEFNFPFSSPAGVVDAPAHGGADEMAATFDSFENRINVFVG